jgi:nitroimidazol reductase NimA-like FMN-containing flavoprotein (pyridoxamine 5'-phosphate oxidase superfamily)
VEVDEIESPQQWTSVVASGRYEELPDAGSWKQDLLRAHQLLQQKVGWWAPAWADHPHRTSASEFIFYRINLEEVTGRQAAQV